MFQSMHIPGLQAVIFDLDDTLIDWNHAERGAFAEMIQAHLEPAGIDPARARAEYEVVLEENRQHFLAHGRWWFARDRFHRLQERLGTRAPVDDMVATFGQAVAPRLRFLPGAEEAMQAVRDAGLRMALLTNGPALVQRPKIERLGLAERFDHLAVSGETGLWKPDPAAFHAILARLGCAPHEALMVGDSSYFDIAPARSIGMHAVWCKTPNAGQSHFGLAPEPEGPAIDSLHELPAYFSGLASLP
jgi:putative hydrolase of the HAD superfamily